MAISPVMKKALKALSNPDIDLKKNYKVSRAVRNIIHPSLKILYKIWEHKVFSEGYEIPVRIFQPKKMRSYEVILYFHGGGWVTGNIDSYTRVCADLANFTGRRIASVDYRLAPEFKFPCAVNDCYAAAKQLMSNPSPLGVSPREVILAGDSAGGNLAAAVSIMAAEKGEFKISRQILLYPSTSGDHTGNSEFESIRENGTDYLLTSKKVCDYIDLYKRSEEDLKNPLLAPLLCRDLHDQPKTLIITAEYDPLRDEGEAYGEKLLSFGNEVTIKRIPDALHGFFSLSPRFKAVKECYDQILLFLEDNYAESMDKT